MKKIVILTATYNHPLKLSELYNSLQKQNNKDFSWVIVDDGSQIETEKVCKKFIDENILDVIVIKQQNSGKGYATNTGINSLTSDVKFFVVIDDDEILNEDAVDIISEYVEKYYNADCVAVNFCREDENGNITSIPYINKDYFMSVQEHMSKKRVTSGYIGYFVEKLGKTRFSVYSNEKYIAPSTLMMKSTENMTLLWSHKIIGKTEFLEGGITRQGRKLKVKSPNGMIEYCALMQKNGSSIFNKIKYSIMGYAYAFIGGKRVRNNEYLGYLNKIGYFPGLFLGLYWKRKFVN